MLNYNFVYSFSFNFPQQIIDKWKNVDYFIAAWYLSVLQSQENSGDGNVICYTDETGEAFFKEIGIPFDRIEYNPTPFTEKHEWMMPKFSAFQEQDEPFVSVDYDFYFWDELPTELKSFDVFYQNHEMTCFNSWSWYAEMGQFILDNANYVTPELEVYGAHAFNRKPTRGFCVGAFGSNNLDLIQYYSTEAIRMYVENYKMFYNVKPDRKQQIGTFLEQYLLSAVTHVWDVNHTDLISLNQGDWHVHRFDNPVFTHSSAGPSIMGELEERHPSWFKLFNERKDEAGRIILNDLSD